MPASQIQQKEEIRKSVTYDDSLSRANAESSATNIEDDLNYIRSNIKDLLGTVNWFDAVPEDLTALAARAKLENKLILASAQLLTDVTVGGSDNFVVLVQASSETPSEVIAINATTKGAVAAQLAGAVGSNSLTEIAGPNAINPKNLVKIVDGSTKDPILSGGKEILGLLQVASTATDGQAFDDSNNKGQISFVRVNSTGDDLEAVPAADIQGKTINYLYRFRNDMQSMPEAFFAGGNFTDQTASVDVTLDNAIDNQSGAATQNQNIDVRITDTYKWQFSDSAGVNIFSVSALAAGDQVNAGSAGNAVIFKGWGVGEFVDDLKVDTGGQTINLGVTAGQIDSSSLKLASSVGDLNLASAAELKFADSRQTTPLPLTDAVDSSLVGGPYASLFAAINAARGAGVTLQDRKDANTNTTVTANTLLQYNGGAGNLSAALANYWDTDASTTQANFVNNVIIFINGLYRRPGADASANNDVYPSTTQAEAEDGAFYSEATIVSNANVMMLLFG